MFKIYNQIMDGFFMANSFTDSVKRASGDVVQASIDFYERIRREQLPIPEKFFYSFNMRDLSQVFQGVMMVQSRAVRDVGQLNKLWVHEVKRVFYDRLKDTKDRKWCNDLLIELSLRYFRVEHEENDIQDHNLQFSSLLALDDEYE